jgi:ribosome-associated translation inhibitor RaiA
MQVPLQITLRNLPHSASLEELIRRKAQKLDAFRPGITSCAVTIEARHRHQRQGREFSVRLDLHVPGRDIVITRGHDEDVYVALRDAFDVAVRQIDEHARVLRGEVKLHSAR